MTQSKTLTFLFASAAGLFMTATVIGLLLVGTAVVVVLQAGQAVSLLEHPLYVSGTELVLSSLLASLPLAIIWYFWRRR